MAKTFEVKRLLSTSGTGYSYIIKRGTKGEKKTKLEVKKNVSSDYITTRYEEYI